MIKNMGLMGQTKVLLKQYHIKINKKFDQHFLINKEILIQIIKISSLHKEDIIVEIGPGIGTLTKELSKRIKKVIAIEIDKQFQPVLEKVGSNVHLIFENAWEILYKQKLRGFNKIIANIPYHMCEALVHYLTLSSHVDVAILMVPLTYVSKAQKSPIFSAFLIIEKVQEVSKENFYPSPRGDSALIRITHRPTFERDGDEHAFIRRKLYMQEDKKLKNGLLNVLIDLYLLKHNSLLTKNNAKEIIDSMDLDPPLLDTMIEHIPVEYYTILADKIEKLVL